MSHQTLSPAEREELLDMFEGLRVTDVTDGLDYNGFHDIGRMNREIRPLNRDIDEFSHRFVGFAHTVRFHSTNRRRDLPAPDELDYETFDEWKGDWYGELAPGPHTDRIDENDAVVIEGHDLDVGFIGSNNILSWFNAGAVGVVTNGGARDTDEIIKQGHPVYTPDINKTIRPGRLEFDAEQMPVNVGGVKVEPDDVVVADGDGVVVVPLEHAEGVARAAQQVQAADQETRREYYEEAGLEPDFTLEQSE